MRKLLAMILAVAMVIGAAPAAFAAGTTVTDENGLKAAVAAGGVVTLGGDIELNATLTIASGKTVTLDLAGCKVSYTAAAAAASALITNNGTLTISDSSDAKTGAITYTATNPDGSDIPSYATNLINNYGTLTINGGTLTNATNPAGPACYVVDNYAGTLTINGGTLTTGSYAVRQGAYQPSKSNNVIITDGTLSGYRAVWVQLPQNNSTLVPDVNLTITGGTLTSTDTNYNSAIYVRTEGMSYAGTDITIGGGTFNGAVALSGGNYAAAGKTENVTITGGTFDCSTDYAPLCSYNESFGGVVSGGTFKKAIDQKYLASGYAYDSATGKVEIDTENLIFEASIDGVGHTTLAEAIAAAGDGDTVKLLKDITVASTVNIPKSLIIDGNGKTLNYTGSDRIIDVKKETNGADLTINNLTLNCSSGYSQRGINYNTNGTLTLTDVTVKGDGITYAVNLPGSSNNCTVNITGGSYSGCIALNIWGANSKVYVTDAALISVDKATHENYAAISMNNDNTSSADGTVVTVTGGSISALDENGNASIAVRNSTNTATASISETTEVNGISAVMVAIVYYGYPEFYSCLTLQDAINQAVKDKENNIPSTVKLLKNIELTETLIIPDGITVEVGEYEIKAAAGYTLTVSEDGKTYTVTRKVTPAPPVVTPDPEPVIPEAPSVDTDAPVVDTTTKENEDGSTTKTETLENGTKVETTTNTDGSKTETATKIDTVETEESKTTTTTTVTTNTSATGETVKESVEEVKEEKADGSATTTTTTVVESETKTEKTEVKEETVVKEDGTTETKTTATTETALANGSTGTTTTDETGKIEAEVTVSAAAVQEAAKEEKAIELAMPAVEVAKTEEETAEAPTVKVELPAGTASATVAIPVAEGTGAGAVAVIVNADGTETVLTNSVVTENGLEAEVPDGATVKVVDNSKSFDDVTEEDWHKDAVDFTSSRAIMQGTGDKEFAPETVTTRSMVWTMLARYAGVDTSTGDTWDAAGRDWAMANGISDGTMGDEEVTREQLVTMIWRFFGEKHSDHDLSEYDDHAETSEWAMTAKQWAVEHGVISGVGQADGTSTLDPQGDASRAQVAQIFYNFITKIK